TICHTHDEDGKAKKGDRVEIEECPPKSRLKRWTLVRVISSDAAASEAASATV
ncbi:MAG: 30S ribosomal protein S17, partial [Planctomycetaceae bacterium]|nr:30S ribosomal protein S17 [Planctomycetaceae bacterium]